MKTFLLSLSLSIAGTALFAQAPAGSKLAAEQAFTKEISRVYAYQKEHPIANGAVSIKAPALGQTGILTLTFSQATAAGGCREIATIPVYKIVSLLEDSTIGFRMEGNGVQKIRLCSGKQPSHVSEGFLTIGTIGDPTVAKKLSADLETALRHLQTFYK